MMYPLVQKEIKGYAPEDEENCDVSYLPRRNAASVIS